MRTVFMRYPGGKPKAVTFSYDDGVTQDERLALLFDKYGLKGTFNLNCERTRAHNYTPEQLHRIYLEKGHEIAIHGAYHRPNGSLRPIEGIREILDCRLELEARTGKIIRGLAYADTGISKLSSVTTYEKIKSYLTELDIAYARALGKDNDDFTLPADFHAWYPSVHSRSPKLIECVDNFLAIDISRSVYHAVRYPRLLYIWGHSYEFDKDNSWNTMEDVCRKLSGKEDVWYATNIEIYDYVEAYNRLIYSADGYKAYNPTLITVWLDVDGELYSIAPGETVTFAERDLSYK